MQLQKIGAPVALIGGAGVLAAMFVRQAAAFRTWFWLMLGGGAAAWALGKFALK